ncbi:MAG: cob(I)yrinic acid a,c-diamide adenosyltransferase [Anaeromicrobium sp.]|jgi:cob(I)alamin adenosyltransferase|uniref:cob(I)yrinic acid a,c-diamide adenosyltransferase n=1 Tax=Anaeromicrobium sp. TaxID=1929132 RepID=UPI0025CF8610|nr:cob(I)yrinic acid a,c-diamide adenosyltransferase [Anaeromicrobium sp.]MCT4593877.1 cob(I)yrinic acid a,c-diamide adenosyltransferase [Anaeromicrobium sp.]
MSKGCIHVYTGNGKGKTTAALGIIMRAYGAGKKVFLGQFIKSMEYSEIKTLKLLESHIKVKLFGNGCFLIREPNEDDIKSAYEGIDYILNIYKENKYDIIILDEINIAIYLKLLKEKDVLKLIDEKPDNIELILTGRYAPDSIIKKADLVTEMKEIKHYYTQGIPNREGIDK